MELIYVYLLWGGLGGIGRACLGLWKALDKKRFKWDGHRFVITFVSSVVLGSIAGIVVDSNPVTALLGGFVGGDLLDGFAKKFKLL